MDSARRRRRRRVVFVLAGVCLVSLAGFLEVAQRFERHRLHLFCTACGRECYRDEIWIGSLRVFGASERARSTPLSSFLCTDECSSHQWVTAHGRRYDVWGRPRLPNLTGVAHLEYLSGRAWTREQLQAIASEWPELSTRIKQDILENSDRAGFSYVALLDNAVTSSSRSRVQRLVVQWTIFRWCNLQQKPRNRCANEAP